MDSFFLPARFTRSFMKGRCDVMSIILAILGFILLIPVVIVAATLLLGVGAGLITRVFTIEILIVVGIILLFMVAKKFL